MLSYSQLVDRCVGKLDNTKDKVQFLRTVNTETSRNTEMQHSFMDLLSLGLMEVHD